MSPSLVNPKLISKKRSRKLTFYFGLGLLLGLVLFLLAGCGVSGRDDQPGSTQTVTATLNIEMWGVASSLTPTPSPTNRSDAEPAATVTASVSMAPELTQTTTAVVESATPATFVPVDTPPAPADVITNLVFTGSIVPGRCVQAAVDERGSADYLYAEVEDLLSDADLTIGTLNAALSDYAPRTGCVQTFVLVGGSENADAMATAGIDLLSIATNHIKNCGVANCGDRAFLDTLTNLERVGLQAIGGGVDLGQALQPVVVTVNGIRFGFVSLGEIEASAFAQEEKPGIAPLNADTLTATLAQVRMQSDVVILLPHWGSDYSFRPNPGQLQYAQQAVEQGVDLVVGNHSHVIQGMQTIDGVPVFYSLGSFVFDQTWILEGETEPVLQQGLLLRVTFRGTELQGYELIPVRIADDKSGQVRVAGPLEAADILERFEMISALLD